MTSGQRVSGLSKKYKKRYLEISVNQTMLQPKTAKLYIPQVEEVVSELVAKYVFEHYREVVNQFELTF